MSRKRTPVPNFPMTSDVLAQLGSYIKLSIILEFTFGKVVQLVRH